MFQAADIDRNNALSQDEYDKALKGPAHVLFRVLDANGDNQLSYDEIQRREQDPSPTSFSGSVFPIRLTRSPTSSGLL